MKDLPAILLVATIWAYWFGVGIMIARAHRATRRLAGLVPEQRVEQYLWILWVPLVAAWLVLPYLSLARTSGAWAVPAFARHDAAYGIVRWLAVACAVASLLLTSLCWSRMGRNWRMDIGAEKGELITDGPFRYVRHPIYALSRLLMASSLAIVPTWPMLALVLIHFALTQVKALHEERHLAAVHGDAYRDYFARTGRFLPRRASARRRVIEAVGRTLPDGEP